MRNIVFTLFCLMTVSTLSITKGEEVAESNSDCSRVAYLPFTNQQRVCGSDGITYVSRQHVLYENCVNNKDVTVVRDGWCDEDKEAADQIRDALMEILSLVMKDLNNDTENNSGSLLEFLTQLSSVSSSEENTSSNEFFKGLFSEDRSQENELAQDSPEESDLPVAASQGEALLKEKPDLEEAEVQEIAGDK
ncbi:uncharacterized protein [Periplaneta americana]|uniref:uncharacterized protein n=1 Tax=Periplaneta americana TaxID=6978 RepID=UPI0037E94775